MNLILKRRKVRNNVNEYKIVDKLTNMICVNDMRETILSRVQITLPLTGRKEVLRTPGPGCNTRVERGS